MMCFIKRFALAFLLPFVFVSNSLADEGKSYLCLFFKSGEKMFFTVDESLNMIFDSGVISISTSSYQFENICKYTIEDNLSSIKEISNDNDLPVDLGDGYWLIKMPDAERCNKLKLYGINGIEYPLSVKETEGGYVNIKIPELAPGIYLLKSDEQTVKFVVK